MTGKGGSGGGFRIFPELRKVLGCHMPNFRSLGQSLHIDNFSLQVNPYYPFVRKSPSFFDSYNSPKLPAQSDMVLPVTGTKEQLTSDLFSAAHNTEKNHDYSGIKQQTLDNTCSCKMRYIGCPYCLCTAMSDITFQNLQ